MSLKRFALAVAGSLATLALCTQPAYGQDQSLYSETAPATIFSGGAQYLIMSRDPNYPHQPVSSMGQMRRSQDLATSTSDTSPASVHSLRPKLMEQKWKLSTPTTATGTTRIRAA